VRARPVVRDQEGEIKLISKSRFVFLPYDSFPMGFTYLKNETYPMLRELVGGGIEAVYPEIGESEVTIFAHSEGRYMTPWRNELFTKLAWPSYGYDMVGDGVLCSATQMGETCGLGDLELERMRFRAGGALDEISFDFTFDEVVEVRNGRRSIDR
jgi:hypothetical protein